MSYLETTPEQSPNRGRLNTNRTMRSLAISFYGDIPPADFVTADNEVGPFAGMLWNSSNRHASGVYMYVPGAQSGSYHGDDWTKIGIGNRKSNSYPQLIRDVSNGYFETGELVAVINDDSNLTSNNSLYFIRSNTRNEAAIQDVLASALTDGSVLSVHIAPDAVNSSKIQPGAILAVNIRDGAIVTNKIDDEAVTTPKVADEAIGTDELADNAIGQVQTAPNAIGTDELQDNCIETVHFTANAVNTYAIADSTVTNIKIPAANITGDRLVANTVGVRELDIAGQPSTNHVVASDGNRGLRFQRFQSYTDVNFTFNNSNYEKTDFPDDIWRMDIYLSNVKVFNDTTNWGGVNIQLGTNNTYHTLSSSTNLNSGGYNGGHERAEFNRFSSGNTVIELGHGGNQTVYSYISTFISERGFVEYTIRHDRKASPTSNTFLFGGAILAKAFYGEPIRRLRIAGGADPHDPYTPANERNIYQGDMTVRFWQVGQ